MEAGDLHKQERKITLAPLPPPVGDQGREHPGVVRSAFGIAVGFSLVPEHPFDGKAGIGSNHGVEESSGYPRSSVVRGYAGMRSGRLTLRLQSRILASVVRLDLVGSSLVLGNGPRILEDRAKVSGCQPLGTDPRVRRRATPRGVNQPNRNLFPFPD